MRIFESRVARLENGLRMHVIPVDEKMLTGKLATARRVVIKLGNIELRRALQGRKSGSPYIAVGKQALREQGLKAGSPLTFSLRPDPEPRDLKISLELLEALRQDGTAGQRWATFSLGKQRSLNHYVESAKRDETRVCRAVELATKIRTYTLHDDKPPAQ